MSDNNLNDYNLGRQDGRSDRQPQIDALKDEVNRLKREITELAGKIAHAMEALRDPE